MTSPRTGAPVLPVAISQSPLLAGTGGLLPDELFATLAGPLPTITIGPYPPAPSVTSAPRSPHAHARPLFRPPRSALKPRSKPSSPRTPFSPAPPYAVANATQVRSLLILLESMKQDVASEVQRVRLGIQETRMLVRACREDSAARQVARLQRMTEREMR